MARCGGGGGWIVELMGFGDDWEEVWCEIKKERDNTIVQQFYHPACYFIQPTSPVYVAKHKNQHIKSVFVNCHAFREYSCYSSQAILFGQPGGNQIVLKNPRAG